MDEILHLLIGSFSQYLQGLYIPGGAGFFPSTVVSLYPHPKKEAKTSFPPSNLILGIQLMEVSWNLLRLSRSTANPRIFSPIALNIEEGNQGEGICRPYWGINRLAWEAAFCTIPGRFRVRALGCQWNLVTIVSKLVYNQLTGLTSYLYRGYNPVTKYQQDIHGHASSLPVWVGWFAQILHFLNASRHKEWFFNWCTEISHHHGSVENGGVWSVVSWCDDRPVQWVIALIPSWTRTVISWATFFLLVFFLAWRDRWKCDLCLHNLDI